MGSIFLAAFAGVVAVGFGVVGYQSRKLTREQFEREADADPDCVAVEIVGSWATPTEATLRYEVDGFHLELSATSMGHGKSRIDIWRAQGGPVRLSERATFTLTHEDLLSKAASFAGLKDIQLGDASLDDKLLIKGKGEDVIRAALVDGDVRAALLEVASGDGALFDQRLRIELERGNALTYRRRRYGLVYADAAALAEGLIALIAALDAVHDISPMRARLEGGLGGVTGAPVGVPIIKD